MDQNFTQADQAQLTTIIYNSGSTLGMTCKDQESFTNLNYHVPMSDTDIEDYDSLLSITAGNMAVDDRNGLVFTHYNMNIYDVVSGTKRSILCRKDLLAELVDNYSTSQSGLPKNLRMKKIDD